MDCRPDPLPRRPQALRRLATAGLAPGETGMALGGSAPSAGGLEARLNLGRFWIVDMGPKGGDAGGEVVSEGTPEEIARIRRATPAST
jgi:hypothetical protein